MRGETHDSDINYVTSQLKNRREQNQGTVLVLGARTGGLFRSSAMYEMLKLYGDPSFNTLPRLAQFQACYKILTYPERFTLIDINELLTQWLQNLPLLEADIYLAALVKLHLFDVVITTNIDSVFEQALTYVGMQADNDFYLYDHRTVDAAFPNQHQRRCKVIKVFGQLVDESYTIKRNAYLDYTGSLEGVLEAELGRDILAIGLDPTWDEEIYRAFRSHGDAFWYVNEEKLSESSLLYNPARERNVKFIVGEEYNYEDFVTSLYWHYIEAMPAASVLNGIVLHEMRELRARVGASEQLLYELRETLRTYTDMADELRQLRAEVKQLRKQFDIESEDNG